MMDARYQVFVSSTFTDLIEARSKVQRVLLQMNCIPAGMELFPASSQKQFDFIKRIIDRCDYYVIVLAGRYGSTLPDGKSFTQLEYEYALQKELPTLAFLRSDLNQLTVAKVEADAEKSRRLDELRKRIEQSSLVDYWTAPDQLATKVVAAIAQEVAANPGIGWIRGDRGATFRSICHSSTSAHSLQLCTQLSTDRVDRVQRYRGVRESHFRRSTLRHLDVVLRLYRVKVRSCMYFRVAHREELSH